MSVLTFTVPDLALGQEQSSPLKGMNFSETTEAYSHGGILEATIIIEEKQGLVANQSVSSLIYNGLLLGPTLHVKPGERMVVNYLNRLDQPTNLHFHGLHVSPSGSSDNVFRIVAASDEVVTGGGSEVTSGGNLINPTIRDYAEPTNNPNRWTVTVTNPGPNAIEIGAFGVCAKLVAAP